MYEVSIQLIWFYLFTRRRYKMGPIKIYSCGTYHPWRYRGARNPKSGDKLSKAMMDLKDATNSGHSKAVLTFSQLMINSLKGYVIGKVSFTDVPFEITIVPSHAQGRVSEALISIAKEIEKKYTNAVFNQSLLRKITVVSAHKGGGDRSVEHHMSTISVSSDVTDKVILLIDDVTTTGGSMTACYHLLRYAGAKSILPLALLETANYEE